MKSDYIISFEILLREQGFKPVEQKPIDPIFQELLDYVHSLEYQKLIFDEQMEYFKTRNQLNHS
jgi:hypothetical protein